MNEESVKPEEHAKQTQPNQKPSVEPLYSAEISQKDNEAEKPGSENIVEPVVLESVQMNQAMHEIEAQKISNELIEKHESDNKEIADIPAEMQAFYNDTDVLTPIAPQSEVMTPEPARIVVGQQTTTVHEDTVKPAVTREPEGMTSVIPQPESIKRVEVLPVVDRPVLNEDTENTTVTSDLEVPVYAPDTALLVDELQPEPELAAEGTSEEFSLLELDQLQNTEQTPLIENLETGVALDTVDENLAESSENKAEVEAKEPEEVELAIQTLSSFETFMANMEAADAHESQPKDIHEKIEKIHELTQIQYEEKNIKQIVALWIERDVLTGQEFAELKEQLYFDDGMHEVVQKFVASMAIVKQLLRQTHEQIGQLVVNSLHQKQAAAVPVQQ